MALVNKNEGNFSLLRGQATSEREIRGAMEDTGAISPGKIRWKYRIKLSAYRVRTFKEQVLVTLARSIVSQFIPLAVFAR